MRVQLTIGRMMKRWQKFIILRSQHWPRKSQGHAGVSQPVTSLGAPRLNLADDPQRVSSTMIFAMTLGHSYKKRRNKVCARNLLMQESRQKNCKILGCRCSVFGVEQKEQFSVDPLRCV